MISNKQLDWLRTNLDFESLTSLLRAAKQHFVEEEIVPTLAVAGRTGSGKSSLINAIAGRHVAAVGVIPTTQTATVHEINAEGVPLRLLDLPGVGEADKHGERMENLLEQLSRVHILLLVISCPDRSLDYECKLLAEVQRHFIGRVPPPVLVAGTKIDCAPPVRAQPWNPLTLNLVQPSTEKERTIVEWLTYTESILPSWMKVAVLPCASGATFNDTDNQYGISTVRLRIFEALPEAARSYFARLTQDRQLIDKRAENIVRVFSGMAGTAAMQPLPNVPDTVLIMPIQIAMLVRLTRLHGKELTTDMAAKLLGPLMARVAGRFVFEQLCKFIPVVGSATGAAVAGGMTYALGMGYHTLLHDGNWDFDGEALKNEVLQWWEKGGR